MFSRVLGVPVMLAAAVGVPYVASNGIDLDGLMPSGSTEEAPPPKPAAEDVLAQLPKSKTRPQLSQETGAALYPAATPVEGMPVMSLSDVFNFNVTKEWIYRNWSRKSTALSDLGLFGIRVPLVTGTQMHDLAGSLTYFFGNDGRVHRISFHGTTGDTTQLVTLVSQYYGLRPQYSAIAGEQVFQVRRNNQVFSELRTRPAPVLWSSSPHDSFSVELQLQHPQVQTPLPPRQIPLPEAQPPAQQQATLGEPQTANAQAASTAEAEAQSKQGAEGDSAENWDAFFPRSRVPKSQVNSLDRRGQMW